MRLLGIAAALLALAGIGMIAAVQHTQAPLSIAVARPNSSQVAVNGKVSGETVASASPYTAGWTNGPGGVTNWLGVCPQSSTPYPPTCDAHQHYWVYLNCQSVAPRYTGTTSGHCGNFVAPTAAGNYQLTLYDGNPNVNGGYGNVLGGAPFTVTPPAPPSGSNYGGYLIGVDADAAGLNDFINTLGIKPMVGGCGNVDCSPRPMDYALPFIFHQSDAAAAASGSMNASWVSYLNTRGIDTAGRYTYFIRICNEWQGNNQCGPFINGDEKQGEAIDPATWIAGVRNFIKVIRADRSLRNVKIAFDTPYDAEQAKYYPGNDYVDILTYDMYPGKGQGNTAVDAWNGELNGPLAYMLSYNKPMAFPEWCSKFPDGYIITQMAQFMNTHNVVAINIVDIPGWGGWAPNEEVNCTLDETDDRFNAFQNAWHGYKYTGSFWPVIIPWH